MASKQPAEGTTFCVTADTKITISAVNEEAEDGEEETIDTACMTPLYMPNADGNVVFAGFESTVKTITELLTVKFVDR